MQSVKEVEALLYVVYVRLFGHSMQLIPPEKRFARKTKY